MVAKLDQKEVSGQDYIVGKLEEISRKVGLLESRSNISSSGERIKKNNLGLLLRKRLPISLSLAEFDNLVVNLRVIYDIYLQNFYIVQNDKQILTLSSEKHSINSIDNIVDIELENILREREKTDKPE